LDYLKRKYKFLSTLVTGWIWLGVQSTMQLLATKAWFVSRYILDPEKKDPELGRLLARIPEKVLATFFYKL